MCFILVLKRGWIITLICHFDHNKASKNAFSPCYFIYLPIMCSAKGVFQALDIFLSLVLCYTQITAVMG